MKRSDEKKRRRLGFSKNYRGPPGTFVEARRTRTSLTKVAVALLGRLRRTQCLSLSFNDIQLRPHGFAWPGRFQTIRRGSVL